ncbi:MAG: hypothetical protein FJX53_14620 [Alphaproteobacteria bacterium]|nr:hypothetical protein [Alphaproteobacteria bacterium]
MSAAKSLGGTGLTLLVAALFGLPGMATAQERRADIAGEQLGRLEARIQGLERAAGREAPAGTVVASGDRDAEMADAIARLKGCMEELEYEFRRLTERVEKLSISVRGARP